MRRPYRNLNIDERRILATILQAKATNTKNAEVLGRDRSTIHREIKRRKLEQHENLRNDVFDKLKTGWSPEQIAGRLRKEPRAPHRICHETIYQYV